MANDTPLSANELVTQGFSNAQQYASVAFSEATGFLNQIAGAATKLQGIPPVDGTLAPVNDAIREFVAPASPAVPTDLALNLPPAPLAPTLAVVPVPSLGSAPEFTAQPPVLDFSQAPVPLTATVPVAPSLNAISMPAAPDITLPDVPNLIGINVPVAPLLNLPTFTAVTPQHPLAAQYIFAFSEPTFQSGLLTDLRSVLDTWVMGTATGISAVVEQQIWDAARTRENVALRRKIGESFRMYASKGFSKPPGALDLDIQDALQQTNSTLSGLSRDIAIKQADLEQTNRRFAFDQAWKIEEGLITYQNQIAQRAFESAKFTQQVAIDIYHETVAAYAADIQLFAAQVDEYKAAIQAELAKLDIYRAQLDGQKLIGDLNMQAVQTYTARVNALNAVIDIFKSQVEAANVQAAINKTTIDGYASQVGAYAETVRAKAAEYDGFATLVRAQVAKADVYKTQADAYSSVVGGFRATVDAVTAQTNLAIRVGQEVPLDLFKARTEVYRDQVTAETSRVDAVAKIFTAETGAYTAAVSGEASRVTSDVAVLRADTDLAVAEGNLRIEAAKANIQTLIQQVTLLVESVRGGAQVAAQLAAASLSAVNLSGQIGEHFNVSQSTASSNATNVSQINSSTTATSTSNVNSTSNVTSTGTNTNFNFSN